jgi:hypothetical protein
MTCRHLRETTHPHGVGSAGPPHAAGFDEYPSLWLTVGNPSMIQVAASLARRMLQQWVIVWLLLTWPFSSRQLQGEGGAVLDPSVGAGLCVVLTIECCPSDVYGTSFTQAVVSRLCARLLLPAKAACGPSAIFSIA